ncbi:hypothetical protein [Chryseobacterium joostei]|nr:hypothetical protein [Chryseobacterium joostei]
MKKILTFLLLATCCISAFSQKGPKPKGVFSTVGTSEITKKDKLIGTYKIRNKRFNVYCGYQDLDTDLRQEKGDTLEVYKIVSSEKDKWKHSEFEITKYATRNGKIIREGFYKAENDTLTVTEHGFDYYNADKLITKYITDKYGLKEISKEMKGINSQNLSDKYLKPAEVKVPPPAKN